MELELDRQDTEAIARTHSATAVRVQPSGDSGDFCERVRCGIWRDGAGASCSRRRAEMWDAG